MITGLAVQLLNAKIKETYPADTISIKGAQADGSCKEITFSCDDIDGRFLLQLIGIHINFRIKPTRAIQLQITFF